MHQQHGLEESHSHALHHLPPPSPSLWPMSQSHVRAVVFSHIPCWLLYHGHETQQ